MLVEALLLLWWGAMAMPFRSHIDQVIASSCHMSLLMWTCTCFLYKYDVFYEGVDNGDVLSPETVRRFGLNTKSISFVAMASLQGGIVITAVLVFLEAIGERNRRAAEAAEARKRLLCYVKDDSPVRHLSRSCDLATLKSCQLHLAIMLHRTCTGAPACVGGGRLSRIPVAW